MPRVSGQTEVTQRTEGSAPLDPETRPSPVRAFLLSRGNSSLADRTFSALMLLCALSIFGIVVLILSKLLVRTIFTTWTAASH